MTRATIDIIGLTGFRYDFGSLDLAAGKRSAPVTIETEKGEMDVAAMFDKLTTGAGSLFAFSRLSPKLEWIPGCGIANGQHTFGQEEFA